MIPETQKSHQDLMDLLADGCKKVEVVKTQEGLYEKQLILDPEKVWWKTQIVNSPTFARFALELKEFERLAQDCKNNMSGPRAEVISAQILEIGLNYRYSIDAKSSESLRDKDNTQATLIDKMQKNKVEKAYTFRGDMKKRGLSGLFGNNNEEEED